MFISFITTDNQQFQIPFLLQIVYLYKFYEK